MSTTNKPSLWASFEVDCMLKYYSYESYKREYILKNLTAGLLTFEQYIQLKNILGL